MTRPDIEPSRDGIGPVPHRLSEAAAPPVRAFIPQTTHEKAALYLAIAPAIAALARTLYARHLQTSGLLAEPDEAAQATALLAEALRLLHGEPCATLVAVEFGPKMRLQRLAYAMRTVDAAVAAFRERYFGYHPLAGAACWAVADAFGNPDPRWVRPGGGEHPA